MDFATIANYADTSVEGGGGGPSFLDQIGGILTTAAGAYVNKEFDLDASQRNQDVALQESQANYNAQLGIAQINSQSLILIAAAIVAGIVLYKVL